MRKLLLTLLLLPSLAFAEEYNILPTALPTSSLLITATGINTAMSPNDNTSSSLGFGALLAITGTNNRDTAVGQLSLAAITGTGNTGVGYAALNAAGAASGNTAIGATALANLTTGQNNVNIGVQSGLFNQSGGNNVMIGAYNGVGVTGARLTGSENVVIGYGAGNNIQGIANSNTEIGYRNCVLCTTATGNITLGHNTGATVLTTGNNNILIGNDVTTATATSNATLNIGNLIYANLLGTAVPVVTACGTSPVVESHSNNHTGRITAGSGILSSCTITFSSTYLSWNHCVVSSQASVASPAYSYTLSAITITGTSITSDIFDYVCDGI